jgi:RNA ligase (TIGR02306 family)
MMSTDRITEWNPQVVKILKAIPHPSADALDVVTVLNDYPVVVEKGEYKVDDLAGYLPIDTIVPDIQEFHFLCPTSTLKYEEDGVVKNKPGGSMFPVGSVPEKYRVIKAKRLRGIYSQGMLVPPPPGAKEADSLVEILGLKKLEEKEEENLGCGGGEYEDPPAGLYVPHYDVVGIRRFLECLREGEEVVLTEKLHGSNAAFAHDGARLWVKSRNYFKKRNAADLWWSVARRNDLERKLAAVPNLVVFGEIYGLNPGFRYDMELLGGKNTPRVRFFDVWDPAAGHFRDFDARAALLDRLGLDPVPVLYRGPWLGRDAMYAYAEGKTTLGGGKHVREG